MIITCPNCSTRYQIDDARLNKARIKVRCAKCKHVFVVRVRGSDQERNTKTEHKAQIDTNSCVTLTVCNQKGGVAKTSSCLNIGVSLALLGKRVLLVDFDVQANLSVLLGKFNAKSFFDVMDSQDKSIDHHIVATDYKLSLLPSNSKMALLAKKHMQQGNYEYLLAEKLNEIKNRYDYILIDTPPSGDFFTLNALLASDAAIIPTQCEYLSINGVDHVIRMIDVINKKKAHGLDYKVLVTMFNAEITAANVILSKIKVKYSNHLLNGIIPMDGKLQESHISQKPLHFYDSSCPAANEYTAVARELIEAQLK
ncbi:Chromosome (plasmid) partitioning protein ParA [hydrothermal vent metagenome]|uniref:Chromosome (Plasmid) partitioning protein ParA n=1 Tax=hydrothermal vent metagenome TaxID=652676 RepID=A0A3B1AY58_9ZZZZ